MRYSRHPVQTYQSFGAANPHVHLLCLSSVMFQFPFLLCKYLSNHSASSCGGRLHSRSRVLFKFFVFRFKHGTNVQSGINSNSDISHPVFKLFKILTLFKFGQVDGLSAKIRKNSTLCLCFQSAGITKLKFRHTSSRTSSAI